MSYGRSKKRTAILYFLLLFTVLELYCTFFISGIETFHLLEYHPPETLLRNLTSFCICQRSDKYVGLVPFDYGIRLFLLLNTLTKNVFNN